MRTVKLLFFALVFMIPMGLKAQCPEILVFNDNAYDGFWFLQAYEEGDRPGELVQMVWNVKRDDWQKPITVSNTPYNLIFPYHFVCGHDYQLSVTFVYLSNQGYYITCTDVTPWFNPCKPKSAVSVSLDTDGFDHGGD